MLTAETYEYWYMQYMLRMSHVLSLVKRGQQHMVGNQTITTIKLGHN